MTIFISHSGDRSRQLAQAIEGFIRLLFPATSPWISTGIERGLRWQPELSKNLQEAAAGIVCVTPENLNSPWLLFEAGALANRLEGHVWTLLLDLRKEQVELPLGQFQATTLDEAEVWSLVETINATAAKADKGRRADDLRKTFDAFWPEMRKQIEAVRLSAAPVAVPKRSVEDMVAEILEITRAREREREEAAKTDRLVTELIQREVATARSTIAPSDEAEARGLRRNALFKALSEPPPVPSFMRSASPSSKPSSEK